MEDSGRTYLIHRLICAECHEPLNLSYASVPYGQEEPENVTGADKRVVEIVVHPCKRCIAKYTEPARKLKEALAEFGIKKVM